MSQNKRQANLIFGSVMVLLGGTLLFSLYVHQGRTPVIQPPSEATLPPDHPKLPNNHPPLDRAQELIALEQLSRSSPENAEYRTRIGNIYYDLGQYQKAIEAYTRSLELRPSDPNVETDLATCFHLLGQHDKGLEILNKVLRYSPNFSQALFNKGVILHAGKNDTKGAIAVWEELLRVDPNFPQRADLVRRIQDLKRAGN